jgi:diadenosine tetraphosphate (Ap4A) HIT family hydrolase
MAESLCPTCGLSASRIVRRTKGGIVAVPSEIVRDGHVMVVSTAHAESFADLTPEDAAAFMALIASATSEAERESGAHHYVLRIGDKSPHLHFHVVPRAEGDPALAPFVFGDAGWRSAKPA